MQGLLIKSFEPFSNHFFTFIHSKKSTGVQHGGHGRGGGWREGVVDWLCPLQRHILLSSHAQSSSLTHLYVSITCWCQTWTSPASYRSHACRILRGSAGKHRFVCQRCKTAFPGTHSPLLRVVLCSRCLRQKC